MICVTAVTLTRRAKHWQDVNVAAVGSEAQSEGRAAFRMMP